jgi:hypothetical protein
VFGLGGLFSGEFQPLIRAEKTHEANQRAASHYKELMPIGEEQVDLENAVDWVPDSKTPNRIAELPLTDLTLEASEENPIRHQKRCRRSGTLLQDL